MKHSDKFTNFEIQYNGRGKYRDVVDAYIASAWHIAENREATDAELDELNNDSDFVQEIAYAQSH